MKIKSNNFKVDEIKLGNNTETIVKGGRHLFDKLPEAFSGIKQISIIGWGSQGPAQAQNLRDSLDGTDIKVCVGLRENSSSLEKARAAGFNEADGTLGEMYAMIAESDLSIILIADAAIAENYESIFNSVKPGATIGFSHGFVIGFFKNIGYEIRDDINVIAMCPKGMGPSVRRLYVQGKKVDGAGINSSIAIHQAINDHAIEYALGWAIAVGSPFVFLTTMEMEYRSDIYGERGILLGAVHGIIEAIFQYKIEIGVSPEQAFKDTAETITGRISNLISKHGLKGVFEALDEKQKEIFITAYNASYTPLKDILREIYEEVHSGNEIRSVVLYNERKKLAPMGKIDDTYLWHIGEQVRDKRQGTMNDLDPLTAGIYVACMVAQVDILIEYDHAFSEIANESIIEAVDSLNPYMHHRGIAYMVDNCSTTARLGSRKWAPRFDYIITQIAIPEIERKEIDHQAFKVFDEHLIHEVLDTCRQLRPSVDISVED